MNISGILVMAKPERCDEVAAALSNLEGIDVHQMDATLGKIVVTQEAETIKDEVAKAETIKTIPGVISVNMVYHYFGEDPTLKVADTSDIPEILT
ncbi:MAG: chaperone NapD [Burkholderiales bacterium]|jgi:nitrate reductase NapD|nr:chaperone NapD [Burkholderiales bacterium]